MARMSRYEDYDRTSTNYDSTRCPVDPDRVMAWLGRARPLDSCHILDAGCGTGQFIEVLLPHVAALTGVDLNEGMLAVARGKLGHHEQVTLRQGRIDDLPFAADSFDGAVINQVLHHLPDGEDYALHGAVFADLRRVLRPGATLVINTCAQQQLRDGYWYFNLMPAHVIDQMCRCYAPLGRVEALLLDVGFERVERSVPVDEVIQAESYLDARGPLEQGWRDGDSTGALLDDDELDGALAKVRDLDDRGALEEWMREADRSRIGVGQITLLAAQ